MTSYNVYSLVKPASLVMCVLRIVCLVLTFTAHAVRADPVGEVTLTIGQATLMTFNGQSQPVSRGKMVNVGDRIETSEGGHVHIRFIDGALVSVRPTSRLVVEDYRYNAQQVNQSLVRFRLETGVVRAISGAAAEGAKDRFRLNTPLVAIGVRGTDFVVRTEANQTVATVNQGAIVMAPFGEGCLQQAFGPCGSNSSKLLSADMGNNMLVEFKSTNVQAELKPSQALKIPETFLASADARSVADATSTRELTKSTARAAGDEAVSAALVRNVVRQAGDFSEPPVMPSVPVKIAIPDVPLVSVIPVAAEPVQPAKPVQPAQPAQPAQPVQLAWGRWAATALDASDFTATRLHARQNRAVTVGNDDFVLYRTENGTTTISQGLGRIDFGLQQAHARFASPRLSVLPATVLGGQLSIDFASRQFSTLLNLFSTPTGSVNLQAAGMVRDDGLFTSRSATQALAGAVAFDGKSAGFFFEKAAAGGTLSGITIWSR